MKKYIAVATMLLMPLTLISGPTWANAPQDSAKVMPKSLGNKTPEAKGQSLKLLKVWGTVVSFDAAKNTLTIKDRHGKIQELQLSAESKLTKGGNNEKIAAKDLKANSSVMALADGNMAKTVHLNINAGKVEKTAQAKKK